MIAYSDGTEAKISDHVDYDGEPTIVEAVLDSAEQCDDWGVTEPGLMFKNDTFGLVFVPASSSTWDAVVFLSRSY